MLDIMRVQKFVKFYDKSSQACNVERRVKAAYMKLFSSASSLKLNKTFLLLLALSRRQRISE